MVTVLGQTLYLVCTLQVCLLASCLNTCHSNLTRSSDSPCSDLSACDLPVVTSSVLVETQRIHLVQSIWGCSKKDFQISQLFYDNSISVLCSAHLGQKKLELNSVQCLSVHYLPLHIYAAGILLLEFLSNGMELLHLYVMFLKDWPQC